MFYGSEIIYSGIPSNVYGLRIASLETGKQNSTAGGESTIYQKWLLRRSQPYFFGRSQNTPLEFELSLFAENPIDALQRGAIEQWLLGQRSYQSLQILQSDISDVTFYTIFTKAQNVYAGNWNRGITLSAVCNSPWGFSPPLVTSKNYNGASPVNDTFNYENKSENNDYLYPNISFTISSIGNSFSLVNNSDDARACIFTSLSANEVITMDCDRGIITSSTGLKRITNFNKHFFRLIPGINSLTLTGGLTNLTITSTFARKIGG